VARNRITDLFRKKKPQSLHDEKRAGEDGEALLLSDLLPSPDAGPAAGSASAAGRACAGAAA
jgi:hypothetical protein